MSIDYVILGLCIGVGWLLLLLLSFPFIPFHFVIFFHVHSLHFFSLYFLLPSVKLTFSPLKMDCWNTIVSFREFTYFQGRLLLVLGMVHLENCCHLLSLRIRESQISRSASWPEENCFSLARFFRIKQMHQQAFWIVTPSCLRVFVQTLHYL